MRKISQVAILSLAATVLASAASYNVTIPVPVTLNGQDIKPGQYRIEVNNDVAVVKGKKVNVEARVRSETADQKYSSTAVRYTQAEGKYSIQELQLGGKNTKLVFEQSKPANGGL